MSPFVPLRVRSFGSLLAGVASPEALCERAAELGHGALGLADIDNLYLAVRFLTAAKGAGIQPIVGAELTTPSGGNRTLLIPFDRRGWACRRWRRATCGCWSRATTRRTASP